MRFESGLTLALKGGSVAVPSDGKSVRSSSPVRTVPVRSVPVSPLPISVGAGAFALRRSEGGVFEFPRAGELPVIRSFGRRDDLQASDAAGRSPVVYGRYTKDRILQGTRVGHREKLSAGEGELGVGGLCDDVSLTPRVGDVSDISSIFTDQIFEFEVERRPVRAFGRSSERPISPLQLPSAIKKSDPVLRDSKGRIMFDQDAEDGRYYPIRRQCPIHSLDK